MPLENYIPNGPLTVIKDDDRDPWVSWQHHLDRTNGQRGGVDLVARVGTPVLAPTPGTLVHLRADGSAGNSCRFYHDDNEGWKDVFSHLSSYVGKSGQHFEQGEIIAYTGNTGGVTEHLHRHLLDPDNVRRNPWDYFTPSSPAGGGGTPLNPNYQEDDMDEWTWIIYNGDPQAKRYWYSAVRNAKRPIPSDQWKQMQLWGIPVDAESRPLAQNLIDALANY